MEFDLMKRTASILLPALLLAATFAYTSSSFAAEEGWTIDFEAAKATAAKENKDLFLEFTGSDWCPPCKLLKAKVFDMEAFKSAAPKSFVLVKLDFPRDKSHQTEAEIAQNDQLQKQYVISGFPTVIFADAAGRPYARMVGFGGQDAQAYVKQMMEYHKLRENRDAAFAEAEKATGIEQAKALDKGLAGIDSELLATIYKPEVDKIIAADADGAAGLKAKYTALLLLPEVTKALQDIQQVEGDTAARLKMVDELVASKKLTGEALQEAHFTKAIISYREDKEGAKKHMEAAIEAAPTTRKAAEIRKIIERVYAPETEEK